MFTTKNSTTLLELYQKRGFSSTGVIGYAVRIQYCQQRMINICCCLTLNVKNTELSQLVSFYWSNVSKLPEAVNTGHLTTNKITEFCDFIGLVKMISSTKSAISSTQAFIPGFLRHEYTEVR